MGAFSKLFIFSFSLVGIFALLFTLIPVAFFQASYTPSLGPDKEIADRLDMSNVTVYTNSGNDNASYTYSSYHDHPTAPQFSAGLPSGQYLEVWWGFYPYAGEQLEFRHVQEAWFLIDYLSLIDRCDFYYENGSKVQWQRLSASLVESNYNTAQNGSIFSATCDHFSISTMFFYNQTKYSSITESWDIGGEISYILSYEMDWNATGISAWTIMSQLLTFQNPDLGITGDGGTILNYMIAIPLWLCIGLLILFIAMAIIPFISGLKD